MGWNRASICGIMKAKDGGSGANQDVQDVSKRRLSSFQLVGRKDDPAFYLSGGQRVRKAKLSVSNQQRNGGL